MKRRGDFDRHAFCALYGFRCDCALCATPKQMRERAALNKYLRSDR